MHTYIGNKKNITGSGLLLIKIGKLLVCSCSGGTETGIRLWNKLKKEMIRKLMTDHWRAYAEFLPEKINSQSKPGTYTIARYNVY